MSIAKLLRRKAVQPGTLPPGERIYAIGDIHGRLDLFRDLMAIILADLEQRPAMRTRYVVLGDLIDRGPQSRELLELLMTLKDRDLVVLKGNHEAALLDVRAGDHDAAEMWASFGGMATLASFGADIDAIDPTDSAEIISLVRSLISDDQAAWLAGLPISFKLGGYFFVHAGIRPGISIARQSERDLLWIRDDFINSTADHGAVIVHGHSINRGGIDFAPNRIGLDTGAYCTGRLSALGMEGDSVWALSTGDTTGMEAVDLA